MVQTTFFTYLGVLGGILVSHVAAVASPIVQTRNGYLQGTASDYVDGVNVFKGIRFANSTAGVNRWTHPPHPDTWTGIRNATEFANGCPQSTGPPGSGGAITGDEDCLFLNIWTPENFTTTSNYPVYFWIYGGRFSGGSGSDLTYEASGLAKQGVVVVTINYRLGALGYLAHPTLSEEFGAIYGTNSSGNWGLHDQIAALHWTNENIQEFGGNPSQITIGGQSAGAGSVLMLVYSPLATGLFQGAIAESGARAPHDPMTGSLASSHRNLSYAESQGVTYLQELNVTTIAEARDLSVSDILSTGSSSDTIFVGTPYENSQAYMEPPLYRPVIDGYVLPQNYDDTLANHLQNDVPIMTGNNKDESGASPTDTGVDVATYNTSQSAIFEPIGLSDRYFELFPATTDLEAGAQTNQFYGNQSLVGSWLWADLWAQGGGKSDVYTYYWTHAPPGQSSGAFHGSEINYAFHNIPWGTTLMGASLNWTSVDYQIQDTISSYWVNFIRSGNPNGGNLTEWEPSTNGSKKTMTLGDSYGSKTVGSDDVIEFIEDYFGQEIAY
jgi:carboxylesterase 2